MMRNIVFATLTLSCCILLSCATGLRPRPDQQVAAPTPSPTDDGIETTVLAVDRMVKYYLGGPEVFQAKPKSPDGVSRSAEAGNEFALIRVNVKLLPGSTKKEVSYDRLEVYDEEGKKYPANMGKLSLYHLDKQDSTTAIPFQIPTGVRLKTLKVGERSFDISKLSQGI